VAPVTNVNFSISVGTRIPRDVSFHVLPERVVAIYPEWRGFKFIIVREQILIIDPNTFDGITLYRGRGCERCKNSGYAGRLAIIEAMTVSDEIRKLIIARANTREMGKIAVGQGMRTLRMVALDRAKDGVSTLEQVLVLTSSH